MADGSDNYEITRLLATDFLGDLVNFKRYAKELDTRDDLRKTLESVKDEDGRSVLHHAALGGWTHMCRYLLDEVKVNHINLRDGKLGHTPLHLAIVVGGCTTSSVELLQKGANPNVANGNNELLNLLVSKGADVDALSVTGTPLLFAANNVNQKAMKVLLENNANPNAIHLHLPLPLIGSLNSGSFECLNLLLQAGADPNIVSLGMAPLHVAVLQRADTKIIKCLLDKNANPNAANARGLTPVELAALIGNKDAGMTLLPFTTRFPSIRDWSYGGIMKYLVSEEARKQRDNRKNELFLQLKSKGEDEFNRRDYTKALYWYYECYFINCFDAINYSNISACWARLKNGKHALASAQMCVSLQPDWPKAHYREGVAWKLLKHFNKAATSFKAALSLDPRDKDLREAYRKALSQLKAARSTKRKAMA